MSRMHTGWQLVVLACVLGASPCLATTVLALFGDSLTDTGNYFHKNGMGMVPNATLYYKGSFTNAPGCWAEQLTSYAWGVKVENYAYGGATACKYNNLTISSDVPCLSQQITKYFQNTTNTTSNSSSVSSGSRVPWYLRRDKHHQPSLPSPAHIPVIWIGHYDLEVMLSSPFEEASKVARQIAQCIISGASNLLAHGHKTVIVGTLAPVQYAPVSYEANITKELGPVVEVINGQIRSGIKKLQRQYRGHNVILWDVYSTMIKVMKRPKRYGFKYNSPRSCVEGGDALAGIAPTSVCQNPNAYFWYDSMLPSARAHLAILNSLLYRLTAGDYSHPMNPGSFAFWTRDDIR